MNVKKRKKTSRLRGARTCGWGFRQRHRGKGCRGGVGASGSGKRADQKKQKLLESVKGKYFGKQGSTSRSTAKKKENVWNLGAIRKNYSGKEIILENYKILGKGDGFNAVIYAKEASKTAIEKMEAAGGKIVLAGGNEKESGSKE